MRFLVNRRLPFAVNLLTVLLLIPFNVSGKNFRPVVAPGPGGEIKIVQFTDTHMRSDNGYRMQQTDKTFSRISRVVRSEKPDLIIFTGDVVTGKPAEHIWRRLVDSLNVFGIPYLVALGNHDAEQDLSREEIASIVTSSPLSLNTLDKKGELGDVEVILGGGERISALYCLDSHDYSMVEGIKGYGWFSEGQVRWMRERSAALSKDGKTVPALAFFHIPLREYCEAWRRPGNSHVGRAAELECPGALNTGMLAAMIEGGCVMATFAGHDHDIDYIVAENGVALGYGRFSGDDNTYNNLRPGARVILLKPGERAFDTWIDEDDGRIVDKARFEDGVIKR